MTRPFASAFVVLVLMVGVGGMTPALDGMAGAVSEPEGTTLHDPELRPARHGEVGNNAPFAAGHAEFTVRVGGRAVPYRYMAVTVLPGADLAIEARNANGSAVGLRYAAGAAAEIVPGKWRWRAPAEAGIVPIRAVDLRDSRFVHLNVLVLHPRSHVVGDRLHGYRIGQYREKPLRGNPIYLPPEGFVEVRSEQHDVLVSPHFTLGQFLCKQPGSPKYLALSLPLVRKLEAVLTAVNRAGFEVPTLQVMSGFRTPAYNASIGNKTVYSRHLWGDAADVFVDADGNGNMDDMNGDGRVDRADARVLSRIVDQVERQGLADVPPGGVGVYRANAVHGPFVHVDARGYRARW